MNIDKSVVLDIPCKCRCGRVIGFMELFDENTVLLRVGLAYYYAFAGKCVCGNVYCWAQTTPARFRKKARKRLGVVFDGLISIEKTEQDVSDAI